MRIRDLDYYRHLPERQAEQLPDDMRTWLYSRAEKGGQSEIAIARTCKWRQRTSPSNLRLLQFLLFLFLSFVGPLLYSATATVVVMFLSIKFRLFAVPLLGIIFALVGEDRIKRVITSMRLWCERRSAERQLERQLTTAYNGLDIYFYESQLRLLRKVEHQDPSVIDGILALIMVVVEASAAYCLVLQAQGMMLAFFAAIVPAIIIFLTSAVASEYIDMPQEFKKILREYQAYIHIPEYAADPSLRFSTEIQSATNAPVIVDN